MAYHETILGKVHRKKHAAMVVTAVLCVAGPSGPCVLLGRKSHCRGPPRDFPGGGSQDADFGGLLNEHGATGTWEQTIEAVKNTAAREVAEEFGPALVGLIHVVQIRLGRVQTNRTAVHAFLFATLGPVPAGFALRLSPEHDSAAMVPYDTAADGATNGVSANPGLHEWMAEGFRTARPALRRALDAQLATQPADMLAGAQPGAVHRDIWGDHARLSAACAAVSPGGPAVHQARALQPSPVFRVYGAQPAPAMASAVVDYHAGTMVSTVPTAPLPAESRRLLGMLATRRPSRKESRV